MSDLKFVMVIRQVPEKMIEITYENGNRVVTTECKFSDAESFRANLLKMFETIEKDLA